MKNHSYVDGSKRESSWPAVYFLGLNGYDIEVEEADVAATIERAAAGRIPKSALAEWLREHREKAE